MEHILAAIAFLAQDTISVVRDWFFNRFLANFDLVLLFTIYRAWSKSEHRRTAEDLRTTRATLAATVASTAAANAVSSTQQNAEILAEVKANTKISTQAFHEANSVNNKIADLRADQNELRRDTNTDGHD